MISSADKYATEVGVSVLQNGGNAVDAAVATALALGVTECYASGIGGGCFILIRMANGVELAIEGRETAPRASTRNMYIPDDSTQPSDLSLTGPLAAGVPGELAALYHVNRTYGKLPFADLLEGAIALADTGFVVGMRFERNLQRHIDRVRSFEETRKIYCKNDTIALTSGDRLVQSELANTLRRVQIHGIEEFYLGETARKIADACAKYGGIISLDDLAEYKVETHEPVRGSYQGFDLISMPLPSSGGAHVIQILNLLEPYDLKPLGANSSATIHIVAEAMQLAFADRAEFMGDPKFTSVPVNGFVSKTYANSLRSRLDSVRHVHQSGPGNPRAFDVPVGDSERHTTNISVVDAAGNMVALTATTNIPFGSAFVVPGTGILLNDQMDDFVTSPGKPNYYGLVGKEANEVAPGKRPLSSMSPTIITRGGQPFMVVGSQGGPRIITSVVLSIINVLDFGMNLQEAVDSPRFHQQWLPDRLYLEPEHPFDVVSALTARGHTVDNTERWSTVTAVMADTVRHGWWGASDSRAEGSAKGF